MGLLLLSHDGRRSGTSSRTGCSPCRRWCRWRRSAGPCTGARGTSCRRCAPRTPCGRSAGSRAPGWARVWPRPQSEVSLITCARLSMLSTRLNRRRFSVLVRHAGIRRDDGIEDLVQPLRALAAGDAFAAGLRGDEREEVARHVHHAGVLVHDHQSVHPEGGSPVNETRQAAELEIN